MAKREIYTAVVNSNDDELKRGRVQFICEALLGDQVCEEWAEPSCLMAGWFVVPEPGEEIEIEVNAGADSVENLNPKWRARIYPTDAPLHEVFKAKYPKRVGFRSAAGHMLILDNTDGELTFNLIHANGTFIRINDDKSVNIGRNWEDAEKVYVEVDADGNVGIAEGALASSHNAILGDLLASLYDSHTHPTPVGPSGPPITPSTFAGVANTPADPLSRKVKLGPNQ